MINQCNSFELDIKSVHLGWKTLAELTVSISISLRSPHKKCKLSHRILMASFSIICVLKYYCNKIWLSLEMTNTNISLRTYHLDYRLSIVMLRPIYVPSQRIDFDDRANSWIFFLETIYHTYFGFLVANFITG